MHDRPALTLHVTPGPPLPASPFRLWCPLAQEAAFRAGTAPLRALGAILRLRDRDGD